MQSQPEDDAGAVLRSWRLLNHHSQTDVAALLGMTQQHLSQIEMGKRLLSIGQRRLVVRETGIPAEDLGLATGTSNRGDFLPEVSASQMLWRSERRWLNQHRSELARLAASLYPESARVPQSPLIAAPGWQLEEPAELGTVDLVLNEGPQTVEIDGSEPQSAQVRPLRTIDTRFDRYTAAIRQLDPPTLFESRPSYRLLGGSLTAGLEFGMAAYFDKLDVSETVGHELAAVCMEFGQIPTNPTAVTGKLPFRDLIGDPFNTTRRAIIPAITTLTIRLRRYPAEPSFLLHWRDPTKVAAAAGTYHVVPAGEFQPSSVALWDRKVDFDLWRNIVREYSEELLGTPEHDGTRTQPINYEQWPLYQSLQQARTQGTAVAAVLGMGLDALTLAANILTVVVLDDDVFNQAFGETVRYNEEGEIVATAGGTPADGLPFTAESVRAVLDGKPMASSGAALSVIGLATSGLAAPLVGTGVQQTAHNSQLYNLPLLAHSLSGRRFSWVSATEKIAANQDRILAHERLSRFSSRICGARLVRPADRSRYPQTGVVAAELEPWWARWQLVERTTQRLATKRNR